MSAPTNNLLIKTLTDFGLSEKEAKMYLALLELEVATVNEAARTAGVNRSSAYVVLESLKKQGFVNMSGDKKIQQYVAASPEILLKVAEDSVKKHAGVLDDIKITVPELKALHKDTKHRPKVQMFEGKQGVWKAYFDPLITEKVSDLRVFADAARIFKHLPDFQKQDSERGRRGIMMYAINPATKELFELMKHEQPHPPSEIALIPPEKYQFSSDMCIYGNKVVFVSPVEEFGIVIESKEIADMLRNSFDLAWEEAKRLNAQIFKKLKKKK
ncbi:hypothetical protein A3D66_01305 [Candidatus Kaiserbacteria bacterium RIFCSPHIGHO2_02_FULL_50_9]|uniref:Transcription regulator TrmB N-terminal domain-containing protein n=1 Tax=Candidatus Kaiserbacteria bacterium RIFCSPLOWO2_01_FULL_51_21 TaxID=1798508 RepID=A0A1F6EEY5_9BACT|nr:MAG: hypothetical protein A2761_01500 [Candidatus Kaiserbacteria bacterium RIFCSPHIGHO2_01_FULL_51_33]OGG63817.1 MAG: hypothetical protein A3D66_01305 [Candidatus Kaiserbacteria bacterium RIFCSPHIGHO2_02_FULL_50_9]OGG71782.1 MAG: hypothetical protein A3A35_02580 [Candidatus Kaiserbacteria bacterium RIFCSPLOWO2_01_FULL_51_21]